MPRHKIPNVGFAKIDQRGITRLFLPALYRENEVVPPTPEQLAALYNEAIRPSAIKVMPNAAGHWPPSYSAETIRISKHAGGYSFGTLDVPASKVRKFGSEVIEAVRALSFGQGAFFGHTLRGTKGRTTHDPDDQEEYMDVLADYLNILSLNHIKKEDWHVDVALEYISDGGVMHWRTDGHLHLVQHMLGVNDNNARRLTSTGSSCYSRDLAAQLEDVSGFRLTPKTAGVATGVAYLNVYTTDKEPTYLADSGKYSKFITAAEALKAEAGQPIPFFERMAKVFRDAQRAGNGHARIEARVSLDRVAEYLRKLPNDLLCRSLLLFQRDIWW